MLPFADICIPSVFDNTWRLPWVSTSMSMFTQWVPDYLRGRASTRAALADYADRVLPRGWRRSRPGFTDSVLHRQVIGPHDMQEEYGLVGGNIFHGELSLGQLFQRPPRRW